MVSDDSSVIPTDIAKEPDRKTVFCDENIELDAYAAMQISQYFKEGFHFEKDELKIYEDLCHGFKRGTIRWFSMNKVLEWLSLLDSALQQMAGQLWTFHIAQDMWGGSDKKEQVTLFDVFVEISNIYQIHHQHKFFPGEKAVGEITITMHPDIKDCLIISEVDCPWTGYYRGKTWCEFQFLIGAWRGVVLGFCGKESKLVVEESSPYLRRIVLSL